MSTELVPMSKPKAYVLAAAPVAAAIAIYAVSPWLFLIPAAVGAYKIGTDYKGFKATMGKYLGVLKAALGTAGKDLGAKLSKIDSVLDQNPTPANDGAKSKLDLSAKGPFASGKTPAAKTSATGTAPGTKLKS